MKGRTIALLIAVALARRACAQATGATVGGVVRDSLGHRPLATAIVQLADADPAGRFAASATTDSLGRFSFGGVPDGHYLIGFLHPILDSIGIEEPTREVFVRGGRAARIDLAVPSGQRLVAAICHTTASYKDSVGTIVGVVRSATTDLPIADVIVVGQWSEFTLTRGGLARTLPRLVTTTGPDGRFAICGVPSSTTIGLSAQRDADSTSLIEVEVPAEGFAHRDLLLGASHATTVVDSSAMRALAQDSIVRADSVAPISRLVRTGSGRLSGTVHRSPGGAPLAGAQITVLDGPQTRTDERGAWTIADAPLGSRMLEVRAVGYYPERRAVDVRTEATSPIDLTLSTLKAVLDTVRVRATTLYARDRNGFQQRRRSAFGHFITPEDIARRRPINLTDMLRMTPGLYLRRSTDSFSQQFMMRGMATGYCTPTVYLDGMQMFSFDADDLDAAVRPGDVTGIEVYSSGNTAPPQFQRAFSGCGSIVVWTR